MSAFGAAIPLLLFFWKQCKTNTASSNFTVYTCSGKTTSEATSSDVFRVRFFDFQCSDVCRKAFAASLLDELLAFDLFVFGVPMPRPKSTEEGDYAQLCPAKSALNLPVGRFCLVSASESAWGKTRETLNLQWFPRFHAKFKNWHAMCLQHVGVGMGTVCP